MLETLRRWATWADPIDVPDHSRARTAPIYTFGEMRKGISGTLQQPTAQRLVTDGFQAVQATAARAIANRVADLELVVKRRTRDVVGTFVLEEIDDHPLQFVLDAPNPLLSRRQLLKLTSYWLTQSGEAYWLVVTQGAGRPAELWPMSPANVEILSSDSSPVSGYVFHGEQGETRYRLDEVVRMYDPDPSDPFRGVGIVGPQAREFDAANFASATLRSHFQHDATPKTVLKAETEADAPSVEMREAFWADWQNRYNRRGGENQGVPAFLPSGFTVQELSGLAHIDEVRAFLEYQRDQLLMANGVPRSILGDVVDANRAAAETNQFVFDRHTIAPQAGLIADALTTQLSRPFFGPDYSVAFREFVAGDEDMRLREEAQDLTTKVRSINQVREDRGLDPVEWGELPVGTFGDVPYTGDEQDIGGNPFAPRPPGDDTPPDAQDASSDDPEEGEETDPDQPGRAFVSRLAERRVLARWTPEAMWSRAARRDSVFVPRMTSAVRKVFAGQKAMVIEALPDLLAQSRADHSRADFWDQLFETLDFARLFRVLVDPLRTDAMNIAAEGTLEALEVRPNLIFNQLAQERIDATGAELVSYANATTKASLRRTLSEGLGEGESLNQLTSRVRATMNTAGKNRARMIARTEVKHAVSYGQLLGFESSEVVTRKRWLTALDQKVRDFELGNQTSHRIDGQTVPVPGLFTLGDGEKAEGPGVGAGGRRLSAHNGINCRCDSAPVLEGQA